MLMIVSVIIAGIIIMMIIRYIINKRKEKKSLIEDVDDNEFEMIDDLGKKDDSIKESNNKRLCRCYRPNLGLSNPCCKPRASSR